MFSSRSTRLFWLRSRLCTESVCTYHRCIHLSFNRTHCLSSLRWCSVMITAICLLLGSRGYAFWAFLLGGQFFLCSFLFTSLKYADSKILIMAFCLWYSNKYIYLRRIVIDPPNNPRWFIVFYMKNTVFFMGLSEEHVVVWAQTYVPAQVSRLVWRLARSCLLFLPKKSWWLLDPRRELINSRPSTVRM